MGKKKQKRNKPKTLTLLSADESKRLDSLLKNPKEINPKDFNERIWGPEFAQAFLERMPFDEPEIIPVVSAIREAYKEKYVQKAVKKAVFRLKQKGISVPDSESDASPAFVLKYLENDDPSAYLGPIDGTGNRGILIIIPQVPKGVNVGIGLLSTEEGITYFIYDKFSKKRANEVKELFFEQTGKAVEASIPHAATILETAYARSKAMAGETTDGYLQLRPWILDNVTLLDRPAIYDCISPDSTSTDVLTDSMIQKLLGHEFMESWIIDPEKIKPVFEEISSVEESPILISEGQKSDRMDEIKDKALNALYPDSKRMILKESLEEMAYFFYRLNEEDYIRLSLLAADSMSQKDMIFMTNPFLKSLLDRSIRYYAEIMEKDTESKEDSERSSSLIIP